MAKTLRERLYLKIRSYQPPAAYVTVWIIDRDGAAEEWKLYGEMTPASANALALALGLPVETEESPNPCPEPKLPGNKRKEG